jgi:hypothetical protein
VSFSSFFSLYLSLLDEFVTFVVPVGEANHHHAMDDLLSLSLVQATALFQDLFAQDVVDEISHHNIHIRFASGGEAAVLHCLLPGNEVALFKSD